jgi:hypothetical protein
VATLKQKGDLAELKVAADLVTQGWRILLPFGEDHDYDHGIDDGERLLRVQVKYTRSSEGVITVRWADDYSVLSPPATLPYEHLAGYTPTSEGP